MAGEGRAVAYGGSGGSSTWGGKNGANGDEGAVEARYDTDASKKYAKSGGEGGSCEEPKAVAFYTYKDSTSTPDVPTIRVPIGFSETGISGISALLSTIHR